MLLLMKNKDGLHKLKKSELIAICEEMVKVQENRSKSNTYNPLNSVRNNNRRALRKWFAQRHESVEAWNKAWEKLQILKEIKNGVHNR